MWDIQKNLLLWATFCSAHTFAFVVGAKSKHSGTPQSEHPTRRSAKPKRLTENAEGALYVNDKVSFEVFCLERCVGLIICYPKCINCAACNNFAPKTFGRLPNDRYHFVYEQPKSLEEMEQARSALAACPVAAIRLETRAERQHNNNMNWSPVDQRVVDNVSLGKANPPFPRRFLDSMDDVFWLGHHNSRSFGATPYLLRTRRGVDDIWIMIDTPRYNPSAQRTVESLTGDAGPDYLFLTHVDDTADHQQWADQYPNMKRIFHELELGDNNWLGDTTLESVEILLSSDDSSTPPQEKLTAFTLDGTIVPADIDASDDQQVLILHTPGHSPGSISLYRKPTADGRPGIMFTGDTYAWTTRDGGRMTGFGRYGNNLRRQGQTIESLLGFEWSVIAPGHGLPRDYRGLASETQRRDVVTAQADLASMSKY